MYAKEGDDDNSTKKTGIMIGSICAVILVIAIIISYHTYRRKGISKTILENDTLHGNGKYHLMQLSANRHFTHKR